MYRKTLYMIFILGSLSGCGGITQDTTPPTVNATSPASNASGVALNSIVTAIFSETVDASTLSSATFTLNNGSKNVPGNINYHGTFASFSPISSLIPSTSYTATVTAGVKDSSGNSLAANKSWSFTTGTAATSTVSFASQIQPIFTINNRCTSCHISGGSASFISLSDAGDTGVVYGSVYGGLVNQPSIKTTTGALLVKPGDSQSSILYQRISGNGLPAGKSQMPLNGPYLNTNDQDLIKAWINEGALLN